MTAQILKLKEENKKGITIVHSCEEEFDRGCEFEWNRWNTWVKEGDVEMEIKGYPSAPAMGQYALPVRSLLL